MSAAPLALARLLPHQRLKSDTCAGEGLVLPMVVVGPTTVVAGLPLFSRWPRAAIRPGGDCLERMPIMVRPRPAVARRMSRPPNGSCGQTSEARSPFCQQRSTAGRDRLQALHSWACIGHDRCSFAIGQLRRVEKASRKGTAVRWISSRLIASLRALYRATSSLTAFWIIAAQSRFPAPWAIWISVENSLRAAAFD